MGEDWNCCNFDFVLISRRGKNELKARKITAMAGGGKKVRRRAIQGTNIVVQSLTDAAGSSTGHSGGISSSSSTTTFADASMRLLHTIDRDDPTERKWLETLRPERSLIHPAEAFLQGIKKVRPALDFNTFRMKKSKARRVARREQEQTKALQRRDARMVPTALMRSINAKKGPKGGTGHATEDEIRMLSRGKPNQRALQHMASHLKKKKRTAKQVEGGDDVIRAGEKDPKRAKKATGHGRDRKRAKRERIGKDI